MLKKLKQIFLKVCLHNYLLYIKCFPKKGSFLDDVYLRLFHPRLGLRKETFKSLFKHLESQNKSFYTIVETGTSRRGLENIKGDGASTFLFDAFVNYYDGKVISIDCDPQAVTEVSSSVSKKTEVRCVDSLEELAKIEEQVDCLYLDSQDVDWLNPEVSAKHHLKEFLLIEKKLADFASILIDDSPRDKSFFPPWVDAKELKLPNGKGYLLIEHLKKQIAYKLIDHKYQCLFLKEN